MKNAISQKYFQKPYLFLFFNTVIYTLIAFVICTIAAFVAAGISDRWILAQCMRPALLATGMGQCDFWLVRRYFLLDA